jgi:ATP phosphoribosyltransferase
LGTSASSLAPDAKTRECIRIAVPSKGDIHKETLELLKSCGLEVDLRNPRQYMGGIRHFPDVELWFQRPADIVRKVKDGTLDIGVAGYDLVAEYNVSW